MSHNNTFPGIVEDGITAIQAWKLGCYSLYKNDNQNSITKYEYFAITKLSEKFRSSLLNTDIKIYMGCRSLIRIIWTAYSKNIVVYEIVFLQEPKSQVMLKRKKPPDRKWGTPSLHKKVWIIQAWGSTGKSLLHSPICGLKLRFLFCSASFHFFCLMFCFSLRSRGRNEPFLARYDRTVRPDTNVCGRTVDRWRKVFFLLRPGW